MKNASLLAAFEGPLKTDMGGCFPGERAVFRGYDLHAEFSHADWMDLYVFGITGRRHSAAQLRVLHAIWVNTSYPDPRLWNNRVAALAGSARSTGTLAMSAALATSEAAIYGRQIDIAIADFLVRAKGQAESGESVQDIVSDELRVHRNIGGYGRPVAKSAPDERNDTIFALAEENGCGNGVYLNLAREIEAVLLVGRWRMRMNYAAAAAALALDIGLSPREYYLYLLPAFLAGMSPCFVDAIQRPESATFPLRCASLVYDGVPRRSWTA
nr:hypothetical protein [Rhodoferax sp.]